MCVWGGVWVKSGEPITNPPTIRSILEWNLRFWGLIRSMNPSKKCSRAVSRHVSWLSEDFLQYEVGHAALKCLNGSRDRCFHMFPRVKNPPVRSPRSMMQFSANCLDTLGPQARFSIVWPLPVPATCKYPSWFKSCDNITLLIKESMDHNRGGRHYRHPHSHNFPDFHHFHPDPHLIFITNLWSLATRLSNGNGTKGDFGLSSSVSPWLSGGPFPDWKITRKDDRSPIRSGTSSGWLQSGGSCLCQPDSKTWGI